jgi:hypothetical protein
MRWIHAALAMGMVVVTTAFLGEGNTAEPDSIRQVHAIHAENDLECADCHQEATTSMSGLDLLLPSMDTCSNCHDVDDDSECGVCHTNTDDPQSYPERPELVQNFSHAAHAGADMACADCHGNDAGKEPHMAAKATCRGCHSTAADFVDCGQCHAASEPRVPLDHSAEWVSTHGLEAGWDETSCMNCHAQVDCQDCHSGDNVRPRTHGVDFAFDHALVAKSNEFDCASCHADPQFCSDCHASQQILPREHSRGDWIAGTDGGRHAMEGRLNLESCVACHDEGATAPICANCHGG